jgi:hypothetical protein
MCHLSYAYGDRLAKLRGMTNGGEWAHGRDRRLGLLVGGGLGAAVTHVLVGVLALGLLSGGSPGRAVQGRQAMGALALSDAAGELSQVPAIRYRGTITSGGVRGDVDISVTNTGASHGTLTRAGKKLRVLAVDGKTYLKGDEDFWRSSGAPADSVGDYAEQWVKVPPEQLGADVQTLLAPAGLGRRLGQAAASRQVRPGSPSTVNGAQATAMSTPHGTVHVSTAEPRRIVRVERARGGAGASRLPGVPVLPGVGPRIAFEGGIPAQPGEEPAGDEGLVLDLSELSPPEAEELFDKLEDKVRELKKSVDSQVRFALDGSVRLAPCGTSGCTAHLAIRNSVTTTSPYLQARQPVNAVITINMTLDGRPIRTCTDTKRMRPNASASTTCHAAYVIPPSPRPRMHTVRALAHAVARTLVEADIKRIIKDLRKEQEEKKEKGCPTGSNSVIGGTPVLLADGSAKPVERVSIGDEVAATDVATGETRGHQVTDVITGRGAKRLVEVTIGADGETGPAGTITATDGHPFWVPDRARWVRAEDLEGGQWLRTGSGTWVRIGAVAGMTRTASVYNLTVAGAHTYYVLARRTPVLVHNLDCEPEINDAHIVANHTPEGMFSTDRTKTEWLPGTTRQSRAAMIKEVLKRGRAASGTQNRDGIVKELRFDKPIGHDRSQRRNPLYVMRVYYDPDLNYVRNAFPVKG